MKNYLFIIAILFSLSAKSQLKVGDLNLSILSANAPIESVYQHEQCTFSGDLDYMILKNNLPLRQNKDFATIEAATAYLKTLGRPRAAR